jgi:hypothetical protein
MNSLDLKSNYIDSIGMYQNIFPEGFCSHLINQFEIFQEKGYCGTRKNYEDEPRYKKDDTFTFLNVNNHPGTLENFDDKEVIQVIHTGLQKCFDNYIDKFDVLQDVDLRSSIIKIQKTNPGQGYHVWHYERCIQQLERTLVWIIYLNDIEEAGETEFLYQKLRIPPKENTALIWPAIFTHTHRGNVVHGNKSKYIITGWFNLE